MRLGGYLVKTNHVQFHNQKLKRLQNHLLNLEFVLNLFLVDD